MEDKVIEGDFTATPEVESVNEEIAVPTIAQEFLGRLFAYIETTVKEYKEFPLKDLLNSLNTVSLAYLVSTDNAEEQRKFLEWTYKASLGEVNRIEELKKSTPKSEPIVE